ncbi:MAG TPA: hemagglutinin repeat-containing protein, partial [Rhodocyclaceae bacterium]|nr:hemagglutinin repeat-containing protein [Rhodocyclaceae bacterium]
TTEKRLGDADYEAKLVRDEVISETGNNVLLGYNNEADQMKGLMDAAYAESGVLGLQFGVALTPAQAANIKTDMVWMVEQDVGGQKVLAPVVYLSAATRDAIVGGAVIAAKNITIDGDGLKNTGGTIAASDKLQVTTTGDIVNTSGTIKGGTVALTSTDGSIRNETFVKDAPADGSSSGVIGKQGSITATGTLDANAKNDIVVTGAKLSAGGDMSLTAGRDVTATTIVNNDTSAQHGADGGLDKATIDAKNLKVDAGRDVVAKGAAIKATDDASITAKRDVTLDTVQQTSVGFTGSNTNMADQYNNSVTSTTTNNTKQIGTALDVGKNLTVKSGNDVTVAGSKVNVGGDANIDAAKNLNIIDRQDTSVATTVTDTHSLSTGYTGVSFNDTKTKSTTTTSTSVGSGINVGGNTKLKAGDTLTVKGSDVATGGDLDLKAKSISVLAGQNTTDTVTHTESTSQGYSISGDANAAGITYSNSKTTTDATGSNSTARTSTLTSGGNMTRTATDTITDQGTQITAGGDFTQKAKTINMQAAQNTQSSNTTSHTDTNSAGVTVVYSAGDAYNDAKHGSAASAAAASGGPTVGVNYGHETQDSNSTGNGSQAVVSTVKAGGKITSTSTGATHLEGTNLDSKGDTTINASTLTVSAAHNTTGTTNSSSQTDVSVRVDVDVSGKPGGEVDASHSNSSGSTDSSTAVVGKINAGGNLKINTTGDTNLEGTQLSANGNTSIDAGGNVNVTAAHNTNDSSNSSLSEGGSVGASKDAGSGSVKVDSSSGDTKSSAAVTGSITAGNNVSIKSGKDVTLEGADVTSGNDTTINAKGKVDVLAATSTTSSDSSQVNFSLSAQGSKGQGGTKNNGNDMGAGAVTGSGSSDSSETKKVSNITTGGNLKVVSGSTTTLEGTQADVGGKATLAAKGGVVKKDAISTTNSSSTSGGVSAGVGKGVVVGGAGMSSSNNSTQTATAVSITQHNKPKKTTKKVAKKVVKAPAKVGVSTTGGKK